MLAVLGSLCAALAAQSGVPQHRLDRLSAGAGVTRWFCYVSDDRNNDEHFSSYIGDREMKAMRAMGLRHVRLCIAPDMIYDPERPSEPKAPLLAHLDRAIARFVKNDIAVMVDIHSNDSSQLETKGKWSEGFPLFWGAFAKHLSKTSPDMVFLEIVNEPVFNGREGDWAAMQGKLVSVIRKAAPRHTILCTGALWGGVDGLVKLTPVEDRNVVYSFHFYEPFEFTHQGATWAGRVPPLLKGIPYPSTPERVQAALERTEDKEARDWIRGYGEKRWNRAKLAERFDEVQRWAAKYRVPLYCGEFGVYTLNAPAADRAAWFADLGAVFAARKIGWAAWGYDDSFSFGRQWADGKARIDGTPVAPLGLKAPSGAIVVEGR